MSTAESQHATSKSLTLELVDSIVRGGDLDMMAHERQMKESRKAARLLRDGRGFLPPRPHAKNALSEE